MAVERAATAKLQDPRTVRKIVAIDEHVFATSAGLTADARVLEDGARLGAQNYRLNVEDAVSVETVTRFIAEKQQSFTQRGGRRPFGISALVGGFDPKTGTGRMYQTDPAGTYVEWTANAIGRNAKSVREYLENHYDDGVDDMDDDTAPLHRGSAAPDWLAVAALLEVVEPNGRNIELAEMRAGEPLRFWKEEELTALVTAVKAAKEEEEARKGNAPK